MGGERADGERPESLRKRMKLKKNKNYQGKRGKLGKKGDGEKGGGGSIGTPSIALQRRTRSLTKILQSKRTHKERKE